MDGETLGELVATSRRLRELDVWIDPDELADALEAIPVPAEGGGQSGPLSRLEHIGTLTFGSGDGPFSEKWALSIGEWTAALQRLQTVLVDRGCRSIKMLNVRFESDVYFHIFAALSAIETFTRTVCLSPDIPVNITEMPLVDDFETFFDMSLLCAVPTRPSPSPFVQRHLQQLAADTLKACFVVRPEHFTDPLDTPNTSPTPSTRQAPLQPPLPSP